MRAASKAKKAKDPIYNAVSINRVEHCYNVVISHLRANNTLNKTYAKFPPRAIYAAVKRVLENSPSEPLDIAIEFETLRDFSTIDTFLESLQAEHTINKSRSDGCLEDYALEELEEKAQIIGKQIANKNEVILSQNEYYWLKNCERNWKKQKRDLNGWPF